MEILEGRELDAAVAKMLGWRFQKIADDLGWWIPPPNIPNILPDYVGDDRLAWAVVDGLREKGWWLDLKQPISPNNPGCYCSLQRGAVAWGAEHLKRITAILNACLLAYDAAN